MHRSHFLLNQCRCTSLVVSVCAAMTETTVFGYAPAPSIYGYAPQVGATTQPKKIHERNRTFDLDRFVFDLKFGKKIPDWWPTYTS